MLELIRQIVGLKGMIGIQHILPLLLGQCAGALLFYSSELILHDSQLRRSVDGIVFRSLNARNRFACRVYVFFLHGALSRKSAFNKLAQRGTIAGRYSRTWESATRGEK